MKKVLSLVLALALVLGVMSFASAEGEKITLRVWSFSNELEGMINTYFAESHPEIEFIYEQYPNDGDQYENKLDSVMASVGETDEAPDVFTMEEAYVRKFVEGAWTADLAKVGFTDEEYSTALAAMIGAGTNPDGTVRGLAWQACPGGMFYRASMAKEYLGVETPEEMQALVSDWDGWLEVAQTLKEKSEGAVKMVTGAGDLYNVFKINRDAGWVVDGKLNIDDNLLDFENIAKAIEEDDLSQKSGTWNETWFSGMRGELKTFCYFMPTWGIHYTLKPNCVTGGFSPVKDNPEQSEEALAKLSEENGGTYGDWRLIDGPAAYAWGGTWVGCNAKKVDTWSDAQKKAVHDLIYFLTLDPEFLTAYAKDSGDFVGNSIAVQNILNDGGTPNPFLGGQDHYAVFAQIANRANTSVMSRYDSTLNGLWDTYVTTPFTKGEKELDECLAEFKTAVAAQITDITVE